MNHLTPNQKADLLAAAYITSLWGRRRREFARDYWLKLTRDMAPKRLYDMPFGGSHIAYRLDQIWQAHSWTYGEGAR